MYVLYFLLPKWVKYDTSGLLRSFCRHDRLHTISELTSKYHNIVARDFNSKTMSKMKQVRTSCYE